ncbi:MAG: Ni/Fe hydrogenase subunit alpha [Chloroflexi bacterium]|nr:Ni/Fe hydrogenase subunit alpha [Chloroflexota bacterium]
MSEKRIEVEALSRVEGEGGVSIAVRDGEITDLRLRVFEPPRLFEGFLLGRTYDELPDMVARICGICPVAYQMSAVHAAEDAFGIRIDGALRKLRRLFYCGEWIESNTLHIYLLAAPDFLGYESVFPLAEKDPEIVKKGLHLKRAGNDIVSFVGGREIHPVSTAVGGFTKVLPRADMLRLIDTLERAREEALDTVAWVASFDFPDFSRDTEFVSLSHPDEYPMNEGRIVSSKGLDIAVFEFEDWFIEEQVPHSTALQSYIRGRGAYFVGPLARVNLNFSKLRPIAQEAARRAGISFPNSNPFVSIVARALEVLHCVDEALDIVRGYEPPEEAIVPCRPRKGRGFGLTEAPRGSLYHRYDFDKKGRILAAKIMPPTAQNQRQIEEDLRAYVPGVIDLPLPEATLKSEIVIRNYDPCISCSTHFLRLDVIRTQ